MTKLIEMMGQCDECGACLEVCPTYEATQNEEFSPIARIKAARKIFQGEEVTPQSVGSIYSCIECYLCTNACPYNIDIPKIVAQSRVEVGKRGVEPPQPHKEMIADLQRFGNGVKGDPAKRLDWLPEEFPAHESSTLFYAGCAASYVTKEVAASSYLLLKKLGVDFTILKNEGCCGGLYYDLGRADLAREKFEENVNEFNRLGIKRVILVCAACYHVFKHMYPLLLGKIDFEPVHIIQLLPSLLKENGIKMEPKGLEVTYHDPCKVGRYEGVYDYKPGRYERIYDKPREALRLCGIKVNELPQNKEIAPCCGAGAVVRPVYRDLSLKLATKVLDQVPVSPLVTSCPFCEFQFQWAARKAGSNKKIAYITDVILQAIS